MRLSRRDLLKMGAFGSAALALPAERFARTELALVNRIAQSELPAPFSVPFVTPPVLVPDFRSSGHDYYQLRQVARRVEILPGRQTTIWGYNGITPGPTIVATRGRPAVMQITNDLPPVHPDLRYEVWTSTHLHGSASPPQYDGYASDITPVGSWKDYAYPNGQDARTLWYHDHGVHITAPNAYMGLAAQYHIHDPLELGLPIPHGAYDVPLILRDAMFQSNGELIFDDHSQSGVYGDVLLVNGRPWPAMPVERRKYRFRVLNASVSRSYDFSLSTGEPLTVIATDGGLMPQPQPVGHVRMAPAERVEWVIDFARYAIGQRIVLGNASPAHNIDFDTTSQVMAFDVVGEATDRSGNEVPRDLHPDQETMGLRESDALRTRRLEFGREGGEWVINGRTWADVVNSDFDEVVADPGMGDVEIWELSNSGGGWFHPVHIHLVDVRILDRDGRPPEPYELGPKDVVYVDAKETVRVIARFDGHEGRYMIHCHNLAHEDHDMMVQFRVGKDAPGNDPRHADPSRRFPVRPLRDRHDDRDEDDGSGPGGGGGGGGGGSASGSGSGPGRDGRLTGSSRPPAKRKAKKKPAARRRVTCHRSATKRKRTAKPRCAPRKKHAATKPKAKRHRSAKRRRGRG